MPKGPIQTIDLRHMAFAPDEEYGLDPVTRWFDALFRLELSASELGLRFDGQGGTVCAVTPSSVSTGSKPVPRRRFQTGHFDVRGKNPVWFGTLWEDRMQADGTIKRQRRTIVLGPVSELGKWTHDDKPPRAVLKAFQPYLEAVNRDAVKLSPKRGITLAAFVDEWRSNVASQLKGSTVRAMESHLRAHILPKLGSLPLTDIDAKCVQQFVASLAGPKQNCLDTRKAKTVENILLTLSSILRTARVWGYACGNFSLADLTMPREGVKKEQRGFTDEEAGRILAAAAEPFGTILAVTAILGLRIGEVLALRVGDLDFDRKIVRIRQTVDAATRTIQAVKSRASSADLPMPSALEQRLKAYLGRHDGKSELLFVNRRGRPFSANKLRVKQLYPLLDKLGIPRGGFHSLRHGVASSFLADGVTPAVVQRQLRHSDARITLGVYGHVVGDEQRSAVEQRSARIAKHVN
jgi:integrase